MHVSLQQPRALRFGIFEMDLECEELRKNGLKLKLGGQPFHMLAMIAVRNGSVVTFEELRVELWAQTNIEDYKHSLGNFLLKIRQTLGDSARESRYIQTVPPGYKFLAPVTIVYKTSGAENGSQTHHPDEFLLKVDEIRRELLTTSGCRALALLVYRCETIEKQYPLHSNLPELWVLKDDIKAALERSAVLEPNWMEHSISFETAARIFQDPNAISIPLANGKWRTIGRVSEFVLLVVEHTAHQENGQRVVRLDAVRRATPRERSFYEQSRR